TYHLTKENIIKIGQELIEQHFETDTNPLKVGFEHITISFDDTIRKLKEHKIFLNNYFIGVPVDENLSQIQWSNQRDHMSRKKFYKNSDFYFSSNAGTRDFALGKFSQSI